MIAHVLYSTHIISAGVSFNDGFNTKKTNAK